jgi:Fe-S-cluster containining protein
LRHPDYKTARGDSSVAASPSGAAYCLDIHASYVCQHAGACCTAGWHIPVDAATLHQLKIHFGAGVSRQLFVTDAPQPDGAAAVLGSRGDGRCVFFEDDRRCAIQRQLGPRLLPSACRHFPRVVLRDRRGTFVTLSHFCPTAAGLLFAETAGRRIAAPSSLTLEGAVEGLDATTALPPLVRPGLLTDADGYDAWERRGLETFGRSELSPEQTLDAIAAATADVLRWTPGDEPLAEAVERAFDRVHAPNASGDTSEDLRRVSIARDSVPDDLIIPPDVTDYRDGWRDVPRWWSEHERPIKRYLASRLFANWIAYCGTGLQDIVEYLRICLAVLRNEAVRANRIPRSGREALVEAFRATDLLLVHQADTRSLARLIEAAPPVVR